jgi:hypothetical protein
LADGGNEDFDCIDGALRNAPFPIFLMVGGVREKYLGFAEKVICEGPVTGATPR